MVMKGDIVLVKFPFSDLSPKPLAQWRVNN
jgi:hypothetical protein